MIKVVVSLSLILISIALIFKLFSFSKIIALQASDNDYIAGQFNYQILLLLLAFVTVTVLYFLNGEVTGGFISIGAINALASPVPVFGIHEGETWLSLGLSLSLFITSLLLYLCFFRSGLLALTCRYCLLFSDGFSFSR